MPPRVRTSARAQQQDADEMESWEVTTQGRVWLQQTVYNRYGQPGTKDISIGPNKAGQKLKITRADREMNQEQSQNPSSDPFRNGILLRTDADQNLEEATASTAAVKTADLMSIFGLVGEEFRTAVQALDEVPIRRLLEMSDSLDASAKQVDFLREIVEERYRKGGPIVDTVIPLSG